MSMTEPADTRESLLLRLRTQSCDEAWDEFSAIYRPMIFRLARRSGLQNDDAEDVTQRVMMSVMRSIGEWQKDPVLGTFRAWLTTVAKNAIRNAISRVPRDRATGNSELRHLIENSDETDSELDQIIETEFMRSIFREAARRIREEFTDSTWNAFWLTSVDGVSIARAAGELAMSTGAIYAARSRVMNRLQQVAQKLCEEE